LNRLAWIFFCAALSLGFVILHWHTADYMSADFQVDWHRKILAGEGPYPDQYRLLTYWLAEGLMRLGVAFQFAYALIRFVFTTAALLVFARYLGRWFDPRECVLGVLLLAWGHPLTAAYEAMQPTDPLNLLVFAVALELLAAGKDLWLVPLVAIGTLNRETALLIAPLVLVIRRRWGVALACGVVGLSVYLGLRAVIGLKAAYAPTNVIHFLRANVEDWAAWALVAAFFNLAFVFAVRGYRRAPEFLRRAGALAPALLVVYASVGYLREIRLLLPALLVTIPLTLEGLRGDYRA